jgi:hypothetical protein
MYSIKSPHFPPAIISLFRKKEKPKKIGNGAVSLRVGADEGRVAQKPHDCYACSGLIRNPTRLSRQNHTKTLASRFRVPLCRDGFSLNPLSSRSFRLVRQKKAEFVRILAYAQILAFLVCRNAPNCSQTAL